MLNVMKTIKIFLASSEELKEERKELADIIAIPFSQFDANMAFEQTVKKITHCVPMLPVYSFFNRYIVPIIIIRKPFSL